MGAVGIGCDAEIGEWINLGADLLRHLLKLDPIVAQQRLALNLREQLLPGREEAMGRDALRKIACEQRCVVVAQILAEPAQPSYPTFRYDAERHHESDFAVAEAADGDDGADAGALPDVTVPGREPIERLKRGAIGNAFEQTPF